MTLIAQAGQNHNYLDDYSVPGVILQCDGLCTKSQDPVL
jgi:hypothetical protein